MAKTLDPIDVHVGKRLRSRRIFLGISQQRLGQDLGISFQQVQKYENGTNRVSASRLYQVSGIFEVPITYFFEGLDRSNIPGSSDSDDIDFEDGKRRSVSKRETLELVKALHRIKDDDIRKSAVKFLKSIANSEINADKD